jgi:hypothetical protein
MVLFKYTENADAKFAEPVCRERCHNNRRVMTGTWRYWSWLAAKVVAATALAAGVFFLLRNTLFRMEMLNDRFDLVQFTFDGVLFGFWILPMVWIGLLWLCWRDQRYRCRTCARRLRMPLERGSYSALLLDHPGVEYVCPWGHGKLLVEVWVSEAPPPEWTEYGSFWQELFRR